MRKPKNFTRLQIVQRHRDKNRRLGICTVCGKNPIISGDKNRCISCKGKAKDAQRKCKQKAIQEGLCISWCGNKAKIGYRYCDRCLETRRILKTQYNHILKEEVFKYYGGKCSCCGETNLLFLCIDHINGNGNKHRKSLRITCSSAFYAWLRRNNYPKEFQILCYNCNNAKRLNNGVCPHKSENQNGGE